MSPFQKKVLAFVKKIPKGKVCSYRDVARAIGSPKAVRAVGGALNKNPSPLVVPCHRVVQTGGKVGGYALGADKKIRILKDEGVSFVKEGIIDKHCFVWHSLR